MILVQRWPEANLGRQERDEERLLQTQSLNPALPFAGAIVTSENREGLPLLSRFETWWHEHNPQEAHRLFSR